MVLVAMKILVEIVAIVSYIMKFLFAYVIIEFGKRNCFCVILDFLVILNIQ